jgi:hypothetical protein
LWGKNKAYIQQTHFPGSIPNTITCFVETEERKTPVRFKNKTWEQIKKGISKIGSDYLR